MERTRLLANEHRKYLAEILWRIRKDSRSLPKMAVRPEVAEAAEKQGFKFRGLRRVRQ